MGDGAQESQEEGLSALPRIRRWRASDSVGKRVAAVVVKVWIEGAAAVLVPAPILGLPLVGILTGARFGFGVEAVVATWGTMSAAVFANLYCFLTDRPG